MGQGDYKQSLGRKAYYYPVAELLESCKKTDEYQNIPVKNIVLIQNKATNQQ
jgi:hypothetical protein